MSELLLKAELEKLAATLHLPVAELAFLSHLELTELRALRQALSAALFDQNRRRFRRLADSTRLLPNKLVALISQKVIPPFISAQVTGLLEPEDAVDLAKRLPVPYLADICLYLDPRRAVAVLQAMPVTTVQAVAQELMRRRQFMTMARFVDALTEEQIRQVSDRMDGESLLRVGFFVEEAGRLNALISLLDLEQLAQTIEAAALDQGVLWPEVLSLAERLGQDQRSRLGGLLAEASPQVLASLNQALFERGLWRDAAPLLNAMDAAAQEVVIASLASHADAAAGSSAQLDQLLPLLDTELQRKIRLVLG